MESVISQSQSEFCLYVHKTRRPNDPTHVFHCFLLFSLSETYYVLYITDSMLFVLLWWWWLTVLRKQAC